MLQAYYNYGINTPEKAKIFFTFQFLTDEHFNFCIHFHNL